MYFMDLSILDYPQASVNLEVAQIFLLALPCWGGLGGENYSYRFVVIKKVMRDFISPHPTLSLWRGLKISRMHFQVLAEALE